MAGQNTAVFGIFKASPAANKAVSRLTSAGFSNSDIFLQRSNIGGLLSGAGVSQNEALPYEGNARRGCILVTVQCSNSLEIDRANTILEQNGAESIFSASENVGTQSE